MEYLGWIAMILAMIGTFTNAKGIRSCFYVWIVSNALFLALSINLASWSQAGLFGFNLFMCVYGLNKWPKKSKKVSETSQIADNGATTAP